jgi:hypothetical protein
MKKGGTIREERKEFPPSLRFQIGRDTNLYEFVDPDPVVTIDL